MIISLAEIEARKINIMTQVRTELYNSVLYLCRCSVYARHLDNLIKGGNSNE